MAKMEALAYKKLTQIEHVLERPDMYIGSCSIQEDELWVPERDITNEQPIKLVKRLVKYSPGFIKIFDEILTNATDHSFRDNTMKSIKVSYSTSSGAISVYNDGKGIPVVIHPEYNIYIPELIFGHLLSGTNYNDNECRIGAGRNGLGANCTNIYSKQFVVEVCDGKKKFKQVYKNNMSVKSPPKVDNANGVKSYTKITFLPDYKRFCMEKDGLLSGDNLNLIIKRTLDCSLVCKKNVSITLNGYKIKHNDIQDYIQLYYNCGVISEEVKKTIDNTEYTWSYGICIPDKDIIPFEQVSFVNGIPTLNGGTHVNYILNQIVTAYTNYLISKKKLTNLKQNDVKNCLILFLVSTIPNPSFKGQTKDQLSTPQKNFAFKPIVSEKFLNKLFKSSLTEKIIERYLTKEKILLNKTTEKISKTSKLIIPKLEDAKWAGSKKSNQCTLILTEGDSAKTFAMWGRSVVGNERFGVYPLKGKCLNVRDASASQLAKNEEINNIKKILGLKHSKVYTSTDELRYSKILILTDQDLDGFHIKGLIINYIHFWWKELLSFDFIWSLKTPIIKATAGRNVFEFMTEQDFKKWLADSEYKNIKTKYYKGLGTSTKADAIDIFKRFDKLKVQYIYTGKESDDAILLAFDKNSGKVNTDNRKLWLQHYNKDVYISNDVQKVTLPNFVHKELIHFSNYDNVRSIPHICDGLKPSQRKILCYLLKYEKSNESRKVAQLSGLVSSKMAYHHGEVSLQNTIINMAQDFAGSNNLPLLLADGNFGSRYQNGSDAASPRYTFTALKSIGKKIFDAKDLPLMNYLTEEGETIEPEFFIPIIPMILVNGSCGIGTGYSTNVPSYNIKDIIKALQALMDGKDPTNVTMIPYFEKFKGSVKPLGNGKFTTVGKWTRTSSNKIEVTEIPIGTSILGYKEFLENLITIDKNLLKDFSNDTKDEDSSIKFTITFKSDQVLENLIKNNSIEEVLKLSKPFNTNNIHLFNENGQLKKYSSPYQILIEFFNIRKKYYLLRKNYLKQKLTEKQQLLISRMTFIEMYINNKLKINKRSKNQIIQDLEKIPSIIKDPQQGSYEYLLKMQIYSLTLEKIEELMKELKETEKELDFYNKATPIDLWKKDLQF